MVTGHSIPFNNTVPMTVVVNAQADARRTGSSKNLPVERGKPSQIDTEMPRSAPATTTNIRL